MAQRLSVREKVGRAVLWAGCAIMLLTYTLYAFLTIGSD